mmetsp:Transcript_52522/g.152680  ORF Transcript_52522/g.152680 Transcript_52522/m.152680 type:complete len:217 (+) Transcript_52522:2-652(+)
MTPPWSKPGHTTPASSPTLVGRRLLPGPSPEHLAVAEERAKPAAAHAADLEAQRVPHGARHRVRGLGARGGAEAEVALHAARLVHEVGAARPLVVRAAAQAPAARPHPQPRQREPHDAAPGRELDGRLPGVREAQGRGGLQPAAHAVRAEDPEAGAPGAQHLEGGAARPRGWTRHVGVVGHLDVDARVTGQRRALLHASRRPRDPRQVGVGDRGQV